jgi:hypothetical protein
MHGLPSCYWAFPIDVIFLLSLSQDRALDREIIYFHLLLELICLSLNSLCNSLGKGLMTCPSTLCCNLFSLFVFQVPHQPLPTRDNQ